MPTYEYLVMPLDTLGSSTDSDRIAALNEQGAQEWELVAVVRDNGIRDLAYYKRTKKA